MLYNIRKRKKSILLFTMFAVLLMITLLGARFYMASQQAVHDVRSSLGGYFIIEPTLQGNSAAERTLIDDQTLQSVCKLNNIKDYNSMYRYYLYCEGLDLIAGRYYGSGADEEHTPQFMACTDTDLLEEFITSACILKEGEHIRDDMHHVAIISDELAQRNELQIGDVFWGSVDASVIRQTEGEIEAPIAYKIVGVYQLAKNSPQSALTAESSIAENKIFTDMHVAKSIYQDLSNNTSDCNFQYNAGIILFVNDPEKMNLVTQEVDTLLGGAEKGYRITENNAAYEESLAPLRKMMTISKMLFLIIIVLSLTVLTLTLVMWTRERKLEIGILLSLGISKREIIKQLLIENLSIGVCSIGLSSIANLAITEEIGSRIIMQICYVFFQIDQNTNLIQLSFNQISGTAFLLVIVCKMLVITMAVIFASLSFIRCNPRQILIDQS